jgi:Xaa-Pro aminopeptidase
MLLEGVDALIFLGNDIYWDMGNANIRYVFGIAAKMGTVGIFPLEGDPVLFNAVAHMSQPFHPQASLQDWVDDIRIHRGPREVVGELVDRGLAASRIGLVTFSSTIQQPTLLKSEHDAYAALLPGVDFVSFDGHLQELRMIKSDAEIDHLRRAGRIARSVIDALVESAVPGATEASVFAEMVRTSIANGGEPNIFQLLASGPIEHPSAEIWHLLHGADQPMAPTMRPLSKGDLVVVEWHTKYGGYLAHTEYTVFVGEKPAVPPQLNRLFEVAVECLDASREALVPGNTMRDAWEAIRKPAARAGVNWVELGWHAMGLASPEFPTVVYEPGFGSRTLNGHGVGDLLLEEGMTVGNNIDLHDRTWKSDVGVMFADFMVVRPGGAELLVHTPRELGIGGSPVSWA